MIKIFIVKVAWVLGNSRCGKKTFFVDESLREKFESVKVSLHFALLSLPLALKKKTNTFDLIKN